jgi:hypothetical protein
MKWLKKLRWDTTHFYQRCLWSLLSMEVEDMKQKKQLLVLNKRIMHDMQQDVDFGMLFSNVVMFFIILTTGSVLFKGNIHQDEPTITWKFSHPASSAMIDRPPSHTGFAGSVGR